MMRTAFELLTKFRRATIQRVLGPLLRVSRLAQTRTPETEPATLESAASGGQALAWYDEEKNENQHWFMVDVDAVDDPEAPIN